VLWLPEGGSEVPIPPLYTRGGGGGTIGTVEFELHVIGPRTVCDTGCVPGVGVGSLDVEALSYDCQRVDLKCQSHRSLGGIVVVVAEHQLER
jgi:hypothetical protein